MPKTESQKREKTIEELKQEEILTVPEAARIVRLTKPKVYAMIKRGDFPAIKIPGFKNTYKVSQADLRKWMQANQFDPERGG